jgi:hypothetical protein
MDPYFQIFKATAARKGENEKKNERRVEGRK